MNILMMTNTYLPHVGGVARSVHRFAEVYRQKGHRVRVVAPEYEDAEESDADVVRVTAIQNFNGSDFSLSLPVLSLDRLTREGFEPDLIHAHHPYLLGDVALRLHARLGAPIVFTHHTMYEEYTHYVPGDSPALKRFVIELSTGYANMVNHVIAPSESVRDVLQRRGVATPITVVPTGVDTEDFAVGDGNAFRRRHGIPPDAFLIGHLGRLAPEKNLEFLAEALASYLVRRKRGRFVVIGNGDSRDRMAAIAENAGVRERFYFTGALGGRDVVDAYHAMDLFAFASKTETQGMVLSEAMAAGVPVVALDAPGAREVVQDRQNGRLLHEEDPAQFTEAIEWVRRRLRGGPEKRDAIRNACRQQAQRFSTQSCAEQALELYRKILAEKRGPTRFDESSWERMQRAVKQEWDLWSNRIESLTDALLAPENREPSTG